MGDEHLEDNLYVADVHSSSQLDQLLIIAGSNFGDGLVCFFNYYDIQQFFRKFNYTVEVHGLLKI